MSESIDGGLATDSSCFVVEVTISNDAGAFMLWDAPMIVVKSVVYFLRVKNKLRENWGARKLLRAFVDLIALLLSIDAI